jgi:dTDP-glucose 4,6-dehydratase
MRNLNLDVKLVHVSTDEVYGDIEKGSFKEDDGLKPSSPYSASKASADMFVLAYVRTYGLNAAITRCTNNYGQYQSPEKLIPKTIIRAKLDMKVPIYGTGKNVRDWIYVRDHCDAIRLVLDRGDRGEIYNIASGTERDNLAVVTEISDIMRKTDLIEFVEDRPGHDIRYSLDTSKIGRLGFQPKHGFKEGLKETVNWYLEHEWWWKPLADEKILHPTPWKLEW